MITWASLSIISNNLGIYSESPVDGIRSMVLPIFSRLFGMDVCRWVGFKVSAQKLKIH